MLGYMMMSGYHHIPAEIAAVDRGQGTVHPSVKGKGFDIHYSDGSVDWALTEQLAEGAARPFSAKFAEASASEQHRMLRMLKR